MDDDQQFCLRWNNHQSTLISVFDTLLENETLVDCTLAAEGKFLKAHKVVLSACSPYFATLLQEQYDKHPIFILKDVKYQELRAMMDYMYRGEVNISQDQLAALLKAAESLQIKGLSDNRSGSTGGIPPKPDHHRGAGGSNVSTKMTGGYTLEQTKRARIGPSSMDSQDMSGSREGSSSPSRRRRKVRRRSIDNVMAEIHDNSNSSQIQANQASSILQQQQQSNASLAGVGAITAAASALAASQIPTAAALSIAGTSAAAAAAAASATIAVNQGTTQQQQQQLTASITKKTESSVKGTTTATSADASNTADNIQGAVGGNDEQDAIMDAIPKVEKQNHKQKSIAASKDTTVASSELVIEPKSEYDDEGNDETVEDLTLDDEDMGMDDLDHNAGTSQGGEGSSQGYAPWQHDRSQDELLLATQEAQQRDPQDKSASTKYNLRRHSSHVRETEKGVIKTDESEGQTYALTISYSDDDEEFPITASSSTTAAAAAVVGCQQQQEQQQQHQEQQHQQQQQQQQQITLDSISNPSALIALQQLASISSAQSIERLMPKLPKNLLIGSEALLYGTNRTGRMPRQSTKRLGRYESNRCPLCARNYGSQAFLNEHMRKEHSVLI